MASAMRAGLSWQPRVTSAGQDVTGQLSLRVPVGQNSWHVRVPTGQTVTLSERSWSPLCSMSSHSQETDCTDEEITAVALDVLQSNPHNKSICDAIIFAKKHPKVENSSKLFRLQVFAKLLDFMETDPKVNRLEAYLSRISNRLYLTDGTEYLSKDDVISRVLYIVKRHPNVSPSKVTEEAHFCKDLGMNMDDREVLRDGLVFEFKLMIPDGMIPIIDSVKYAIDYIFAHRDKRTHRIQLLKTWTFDPRSGPPPSEHELDDLLW